MSVLGSFGLVASNLARRSGCPQPESDWHALSASHDRVASPAIMGGDLLRARGFGRDASDARMLSSVKQTLRPIGDMYFFDTNGNAAVIDVVDSSRL